MKTFFASALAISALFASGAALAQGSCAAEGGIASGPYKPDVGSLSRHEEAPEWFRDAKLGIYAHWGVYSVPAWETEWYPQYMHTPGHKPANRGARVYDHHKAKYGGPETFAYHDFVPMFTADKFDAEEWAELFHKAGARFAGPVAEHHDGFAMWDSDVTAWNAADMGPRRDVSGELEKAIRARGMKFMGSFHHARQLQRYPGGKDPAGNVVEPKDMWESHFPWVEGLATSSNDPVLRQLYGNIPEDEWLRDMWFAKLKEYARKYEPDLIWFDGWLDRIPENYLYCFSADYLNLGANWGRDVVITRKQYDLPIAWSVEDYEKGRLDRLTADETWLTDDTMSKGSWSWTTQMELKPLRRVLHDFIDIVSKNGQLLLNVSPLADGSIPRDQQDILLGLGAWLDVNGEAIYDTRPWVTYGEGPTNMSESGRFLKEIAYQPTDLRFTKAGDDVLYVIALGQPEGELKVRSLGRDFKIYPDEVATVELIGVGEVSGWSRDGGALTIPVTSKPPHDLANVWKITRVPPQITRGR